MRGFQSFSHCSHCLPGNATARRRRQWRPGPCRAPRPSRPGATHALVDDPPKTAPPALELDADVAVIGSGIGGLTAAALLARYGLNVRVFESHSIPGGAAHHWSRRGFTFDSGAALFSGLDPSQTSASTDNPLALVLQALGESLDVVPLADEDTCLVFPDGRQYRTQLGSSAFDAVVDQQFGGRAGQDWRRLQDALAQISPNAAAVSPMALRYDAGILRTLVLRRPLNLLNYLVQPGGTAGRSFQAVVRRFVADPQALAFTNMVTEGTCSAAMHEVDASYMIRAFQEMWSRTTQLQYPRGGSQAIVAALVRGLQRHGGTLHLNSPVSRIRAQAGRVTGLEIASGRVVRLRPGGSVVSNASVWDTARLAEASGVACDGAFNRYVSDLQPNDSMLHLHLGFRREPGEVLPMHTYFLGSDHTGANGWPTIVIPSVPDPGAAPEGSHVLHATMTEPYAPWANLDRRSDAYRRRKDERAEVLLQMVRQVIPDLDSRLELKLVGSPKSHARFLRRHRGCYGPRNLLTLNGPLPTAIKPLENMFCCGDSVFPGVGTPAVAASGMWVANTVASVGSQLELLEELRV